MDQLVCGLYTVEPRCPGEVAFKLSPERRKVIEINGFRAEKYIVEWSSSRKMVNPGSKITSKSQTALNVSGGTLYVRIAAANRKGERVSDFSRITRVTSLPGEGGE